jgi:protein-disulfide isomerase
MVMIQPSTKRHLLLAAAALGAASCLVGTVASYWYMTGTTPPALYGPQIHRLATMVRYGNVPIEFFGLIWFVVVGLIYVSPPPRDTSAAYAWLFCSTVLVVAAAAAVARDHPRTWAFFVSVAAAALVLIASGSESLPPVRTWPRLTRADAARIGGSPIASMTLFALLLATAMGAQFMSLKAAAVTASQASDQVFKRWFLTQTRDASSDFVAATGIRIVTFTDYQCPACASTVPAELAAIEAFRKTHQVPIQLTYRDFPLESECNVTMQTAMHPVACEAAVAVRIVRERLGDARADEFGESLYHDRSRLSPEYVESRLSEYQLADVYKREYADHLKSVRVDVALGQRLGVRGTPTSFVNGLKMPNISVRNFEMALQYEAERLSGVTGSGGRASIQDLPQNANGSHGSSASVR